MIKRLFVLQNSNDPRVPESEPEQMVNKISYDGMSGYLFPLKTITHTDLDSKLTYNNK
ncbi:hypothetical protein OO013_17045 [Mangrovivirga sp. M17]|uniref:Uncharacterized protein n=1 Tax=Mangrovivirga halotolerans TaxID=2993936 RepID=A0ABT3RV92_9BACT|nr:hypothetical protein [Mangrovivirga halotolerans]MCX2745591.1 hypothetical protein [Mangrovivirga halotolerans]